MLESKVKLPQKQYEIVTLGIFITKIYMEKAKGTKEKNIMQNASIYTRMKIGSFFLAVCIEKKQIYLIIRNQSSLCKNG